MKLEISRDLANAILSYLQEKPFKEVAGLISEMAKLKPIAEDGKPELKVAENK